jgi:hypothetical protein
MKTCGWKDLETMQAYIRLAGIEEQGATAPLHLLRDMTDGEAEPNEASEDDTANGTEQESEVPRSVEEIKQQAEENSAPCLAELSA